MESNSVCNHTIDKQNREAGVQFVNHRLDDKEFCYQFKFPKTTNTLRANLSRGDNVFS